MTAARSALWGRAREPLRYRPGYTTPGGTTDRGRQDRLPVIYQLGKIKMESRGQPRP
jgi:hypothetical protein